MMTQLYPKSDTQPVPGLRPASDKICQIAAARLHNSPYAALRTVECQYRDGVLVLRGRLQTYYLKQMAQAMMTELDGVMEIANSIEVVRASRRPSRPMIDLRTDEAAGFWRAALEPESIVE